MPRTVSSTAGDLTQVNATLLRRRLLAWYRRNKRDLPWRRRPGEPYAQWLAEMMLQQTQTATVIPYYDRFLAEFPTVQDLAAAPRERVLGMWAGLGYYRRAHALHDAAQTVVRDHAGRFPADVDGLMSLPGVGRYTAGAIASIAFGRRAPILDGNVARVLARLFAIRTPPDDAPTRRRLWSLAENILPARGCGAFNQAMMDLGATVCTPRSPNCTECPQYQLCTARQRGLVDCIPPPKRRTEVRDLDLLVFIIRCGERLLLRRRPDNGLWAGMWEFPSAEANDADPTAVLAAMLPGLRAHGIGPVQKVGETQHQLTHRKVTMHVYTAVHAARSIHTPAKMAWGSPGDVLQLPAAFRKALNLFRSRGDAALGDVRRHRTA